MARVIGVLTVACGCVEAFVQSGWGAGGEIGLGASVVRRAIAIPCAPGGPLPGGHLAKDAGTRRAGAAGVGGVTAVLTRHQEGQAGHQLYQPMIDSLMAIFEEEGFELEKQQLPNADLAHRESVVGKGKRKLLASITTDAYTTSKIRQVRLAHVCGGKDMQVLNFCIFPDTKYALPSFSADLVTLPDKHLIAIDAQPNGPCTVHAYEDGGLLSTPFQAHKSRLPSGGEISTARSEAKQYMSPFFLWSKLPRDISDRELVNQVCPPFEDYMRAYLDLVREAEELEDAEQLESVLHHQLKYARYRIDKDPARPVLTRMFGEDFTERLIREVLFDLPMKMGQGSEGDAP